jgi:omega-6 fatty acid desaturase (delta-12 desaturase)
MSSAVGQIADIRSAGVGAHTLRAAVASIPPTCYVRSTATGLAYFIRDASLFTAATIALARVDHPLVLVPLWLLAGLALGALFVVGHDAAHDALFDRAWLNAIVGRLALLPSLHACAVWALGHNRIHHGHTGCAEIDFVWHPVSPAEYAAASHRRRWLHRLEWSAAGAGLYYLRTVWLNRMLRVVPPARLAVACRRDRRLVTAYAIGASALVLWTATRGTPAGALWAWVKVLVVPWLVWSHTIGATVYAHHIGPEIAWQRRPRWTRFAGQVHGTATYRIAPWLNFFWHNIYLHTPHHVDPRVPFYHLPAAAAALAAHYPNVVRIRRYRLRDYLRTTRRCKLFDFDRGVWVGYDAAQEHPIAEDRGGRRRSSHYSPGRG